MNKDILKFIAASLYGFIDTMYLAYIVRRGYDNVHLHKVNNHKNKHNQKDV